MNLEVSEKANQVVANSRANDASELRIKLSWRRDAKLSLLAAWFGAGVFVVAVVAPGAFAVLPTRALAGAMVGRTLSVLNVSGFIIGLALLALTFFKTRRGEWFERAMLAIFALTCAIGQWVITARMETLRAAMGGRPVDELPSTDPLRLEFGALHGVSVLVLGIGMLAAFIALILTMRRRES